MGRGHGKSKQNHYGPRKTNANGGHGKTRPTISISMPRFNVGMVSITPGAQNLLESLGIEPQTLINRHRCGDWGDIHPEDRELGVNEQALASGARILSVYKLGPEQEAVWVITDAATTACPDCHDFYAGDDTANPACSYCHGTTWGDEEHRLTTTLLLPDEY
jgi:hypothetical protein